MYALLLQKGPKIHSCSFSGKVLDIFGGTRKVIGFICTDHGVRKVNHGVRKVYHGVSKVCHGVRTVFNGVRKVFNGVNKVYHGRVG